MITLAADCSTNYDTNKTITLIKQLFIFTAHPDNIHCCLLQKSVNGKNI